MIAKGKDFDLWANDYDKSVGISDDVSFVRGIVHLLRPGGQVLIGDVAFETRKDLEDCKIKYAREWDDEEFYFAAEELKPNFPEHRFIALSHCACVFLLGS